MFSGCELFEKLITLTFLLLIAGAGGYAATHTSKNNYTGNWENASTWAVGNGNLANNDIVNIYGFVKRNSSLTLNNGIDLHVYDTLFIFGNLNIGNNGDIFVHTGGMVVVYGNVTVFNNVNLDLSSYFVVMGDLDVRNGAEITAPPGEVFLYVTGETDCAGTAICLPPEQVGDEEDLLDNPDLVDIVTGYTVQILPTSPTICQGNSVTLSIRSDATNYQWYRNTTAISGATGYSYSATEAGLYDVSFTLNSVNYPRTGNPIPDTVFVTPSVAPTVTSSDADNTVCEGQTITLDVGAGYATYSWSTGGSSQTEDITNSGNITEIQTFNVTVTVTDINGCTSTSPVTTVNILPLPVTGAIYSIPNSFSL